MRSVLTSLTLAVSLAAVSPLLAEDQNSEVITVGEDMFLRWYGHANRTYFVQVSDPNDHLRKWIWAPIIESGNDENISYEVAGTADRGFFRLWFSDQPTADPDGDDFDGDGLSNLDEVTLYQTNPLKTDTDDDGLLDAWEVANSFDPNDDGSINVKNGASGDPDGDGLTNANEQELGSNPTSWDNIDTSDFPDDAPEGVEAFLVEGDLAEDVVKNLPAENKTFTVAHDGPSYLLMVFVESDEFYHYTSLDTNEFNDRVSWEINVPEPGNSRVVQGTTQVNALHDAWVDSILQGQEFMGHYPTTVVATEVIRPSAQDYNLDFTLEVTNIEDDGFPTTAIIALLPVEFEDINDHGDDGDDVAVVPWDTSEDIANNNIAWIDAHLAANDAPQMPQLEFRIPNLPANIKVEAKLKVVHERAYFAQAANKKDEVEFPAGGGFKELDGDSWKIWEDYKDEQFFGGEATLTYKVEGGDEQTIKFRIGGENPDDLKCKVYIETIQDAEPQGSLWFAYAIAKHESKGYNAGADGVYYNQFMALPRHPRDNGFPVHVRAETSGAGGVGIIQVTGKGGNKNVDAGREIFWNWQDNLTQGVSIVRSKKTIVDTFWPRQFNVSNANGTALPPITVSGVLFKEGTNKKM